MRRLAAVVSLLLASACAGAGPEAPPAAQMSQLVSAADANNDIDNALTGRLRSLGRGIASWYGAAFHGRPTASGEPYDMHAFTAAHPWLPFGTLVEVRSLVDGRKVTVRINDRGPFHGRRVIDLSRAAAKALGLIGRGVKPVELRVAQSQVPASEVVSPK